MPRKKRVWYPGAVYHVMSRGNRRAAIYKDHTDYIHFLEILSIVKERYPFSVHSLCLMTNHFHLLLETKETELWRIMQKLLSVYAEEFNHKYKYNGHLFEGRYTALYVIEAGRNSGTQSTVAGCEKYGKPVVSGIDLNLTDLSGIDKMRT